MTPEQLAIRDIKLRLDALEAGDLKGKRLTGAGRALSGTDLISLAQVRELIEQLIADNEATRA